MNDPQRLIDLLADLGSDLGRWSDQLRAIGEAASDCQRLFADQVDQGRRRVASFEHEVTVNGDRAQSLHNDQSRTETEMAETAARTRKAEDAMEELAALARATRDDWSRKEADARLRVNAAEADLRAAQAAEEDARLRLNNAVSDYNHAVGAYNNCASSYWVDSDGNRRSYDCSGHASAVNRAEHAVSLWRAEYNNRNAITLRCVQVLKQAKEWLSTCVHNVAVARQAVARSAEAVEIAQHACAISRQASNTAGAAAQEVALADRALDEQRTALDAMGASVGGAQRSVEAAGDAMTRLEQTRDMSQEQIIRARHDLDDRIDRLEAFDRAWS